VPAVRKIFAPAAYNAAEIHHRDPVAHVLDDAEVVADHDVGEAKRFLSIPAAD